MRFIHSATQSFLYQSFLHPSIQGTLMRHLLYPGPLHYSLAWNATKNNHVIVLRERAGGKDKLFSGDNTTQMLCYGKA